MRDPGRTDFVKRMRHTLSKKLDSAMLKMPEVGKRTYRSEQGMNSPTNSVTDDLQDFYGQGLSSADCTRVSPRLDDNDEPKTSLSDFSKAKVMERSVRRFFN